MTVLGSDAAPETEEDERTDVADELIGIGRNGGSVIVTAIDEDELELGATGVGEGLLGKAGDVDGGVLTVLL